MIVHAATVLAEERAHGSLDVLLTTPLSTSSIVLGKWWGAFRPVPKIAVLAGFIALGASLAWSYFLAAFFYGVVTTALVLAYGAFFTSMSLAIATRQPRLGRAVGLSVAAYLAITIIYPALLISTTRVGPDDVLFLWVSPFFGMFIPMGWLCWFGGRGLLGGFVAMCFWVALTAIAARSLRRATVRSFDRSIGAGLRRKAAALAWPASRALVGRGRSDRMSCGLDSPGLRSHCCHSKNAGRLWKSSISATLPRDQSSHDFISARHRLARCHRRLRSGFDRDRRCRKRAASARRDAGLRVRRLRDREERARRRRLSDVDRARRGGRQALQPPRDPVRSPRGRHEPGGRDAHDRRRGDDLPDADEADPRGQHPRPLRDRRAGRRQRLADPLARRDRAFTTPPTRRARAPARSAATSRPTRAGRTRSSTA